MRGGYVRGVRKPLPAIGLGVYFEGMVAGLARVETDEDVTCLFRARVTLS